MYASSLVDERCQVRVWLYSDFRILFSCVSRLSSSPAHVLTSQDRLGSAAKIDALVKIDVKILIAKGIADKISGNDSVDKRTVASIVATQQPRTSAGEDEESIRVFAMPPGWYAQEPTFVEKENPRDEDDGFLITYVFDEAQLDKDGYPREDARSELWIIDAWDMSTVVSKIMLPQRGQFLADPGRQLADSML